MKNRFVVLIGMLLSVFGALAVMDNTYATDGATIMKKWAFTQYYECVRNNINSPIEQKNSGIVPEDVFPKSGELWLPSYKFQNNVNSGKVNCYDLFLGKASGLSFGILGYAGIDDNVNWSNPSGSQAFLEKLGYALENDGEQRFTIQASERTETEVYSIFGSTKHISDRDAGSLVITVSDNDEGTKTYSYDGGFLGLNNAMSAIQVGFSDHKMKVAVDAGFLGAVSGCRNLYSNQEEWFPLKNDVQEFYNDLRSGLANKTWGYTCNDAYSGSKTTYSFVVDPDGAGIVNSGDAGKFVYAKDQNKYDVSDNVIKSMSGMDIRGLILDNNELYTLYYYYLEKSLPTGVANRITCNPSNTNNLTAVNLKDVDGQVKTCYVNFNGVDPNSISVYTQAHTDLRNWQPYPFITAITMQDVVNWFNSVDASTLTDVGVIADSNNESNNQEGTSGGDVEMTCGNSGGAASLGWIVCPVLEWMGKASDKIYTDYVEPSLQIEPKLFSTNSDEGTRKAWGIFQNIANIAFVILLLAVIFSQLTGVGIDNYGIKKILPKLIVAAVLVNLSYYICLVCVDVSNIVGNGVQALFNGLDVGTPSLNIPDSNATLAASSTTAITGVAVLSALAVMVGTIWTNPAILLSLLVAALGIVIAIFFLFLLLAAREAAIVVLVVVSPIAFVCYMLPNTKKIFDRWLKIGQGLLLVYPIAGLLVGGGNFVSRLLLSSGFASNGFFAAFSAMVIGVAPIFFIPSVLKGSFSAMGNLGAKISGFGDRLRGGVDKRLRNTDAYKNAQERGVERRTRIRAGLDKNGKPIENMSGIGRLMRGGKRNMARSRAQYLKNQDARNREDSLNGIGFQAAVLGQQKRAEKDELADYMTYINNETRNGEDEDRLYEMFDDYMAKGDKSGAVAVARIAGRRKDTAAGFLNKKITGYDSKTGKVSDVTKDYDSKMLASVMKEIATGENSGMYRSSTPMGFEFAAQYNREYGKEGAAPEAKYSAWRTQANVDRALSNYVTNSQELVGTKNSSLTELNELMASGAMGKDEITRIRQLANETIENRGRTGVWDTTKAENIYKLAGREAEYKAMVGDATGAVRGENAAAGAESSSLDVRAAVAQQTAEPRPQAAPTQPVEVPAREQQTAGAAGVAMDVRALGDETLLDIATNPNASANDANRVAAEQEYLRRNPGFNSEVRGSRTGIDNTQPPQVPPQE